MCTSRCLFHNASGLALPILLSLLVLACGFVGYAQSAAANAPVPFTIDALPVDRAIVGAVTQEYTISLTAGQFVAFTAVPNGVGVVVEV